MKSTWIWIIGIIIIAIGGLWWWQSAQVPASGDPEAAADTQDIGENTEGSSATQATPSQESGGSTSVNANAGVSIEGTPMSATVTYNGSTFSPATVTIRQGGTVTFTDTSGTMWVASGLHPSHAQYDGTSRQEHCSGDYSGPAPFDQCSPSSTYQYTFGKVGSWGYHDHVNTSARGFVVVK
ncbi:MAG: hypothetical protein U1D26_00675 [Patescibacteria group bacterium]|nr:hypothetical protein [Patescibacteria group bacterium]